jgi:hypothetical protein
MQTQNQQFKAYLRTPDLWLYACITESVAIFILSVIPSIAEGINGGPTAHALAYSTLSCTLRIYLFLKKAPWNFAKSFVSASLYGGCIELIQYFLPYRGCEAKDFVMNCMAALTGIAIARTLQPFFTEKDEV